MPAGSDPLLDVRDVARYFPVSRSWAERLRGRTRAFVRAVDGVSLRIDAGETVGLVGESGCGKTTLGRLVAGLTSPTRGSIHVEGADTATLTGAGRRRLHEQVQIVFQDPFSSLDPRQPVQAIIREPLDIHHRGARSERTARVAELMDLVALPRRFARSYPHELSGGLRQRVGIAAALALRPWLIVADEPTSALDASVQAEILNLLVDLQRATGVSYLFISHNLDVVRYLSHRVAVMYLGRIVELGTVDEVYGRPQHPYSRALLSAIPLPDPSRPLRPTVLEGEVPSPIRIPAGCPFHPRCPLAVERCAVEVPPLYEFGAGHRASCHVTAAAASAGVRHVKQGGAVP